MKPMASAHQGQRHAGTQHVPTPKPHHHIYGLLCDNWFEAEWKCKAHVHLNLTQDAEVMAASLCLLCTEDLPWGCSAVHPLISKGTPLAHSSGVYGQDLQSHSGSVMGTEVVESVR